MELTLAIAVGVMFGSGVWLILRPRMKKYTAATPMKGNSRRR